MSAEWKDGKLGDLIKVKHGFAFKGEFFATKGRYILLTPGNFYESGGFKFTPEKEKYYTGTFPKEYICSKNDLIVAMTEQAEGLLGSTALVPCDDLFLHNQRVGLISYDKKKVDKNFLYYLFRIKSVRKQIKGSASGTKVKHTSPERIYAVKVRIPISVTNQKGIATVLSSLDAKFELNNLINTELEGMAKTLYDYWFAQFDFPDKNGKPYKSSGGKMVWNGELKREIPEGWKCGSLSDLGEIVGGSTPSTNDPNNFAEDGTPWITPKDLSNSNSYKYISRGELGVSAQGIKSASLKIYPKGTVLLSSRAPIGYMSIARNPVTTNQGFKSFIPNKGYSPHFIYYTIKNSMNTVVRYASGSTFKEVSGSVLKTIKVCLPKGTIVDNYTQTVSSIFERQDLLEQENQHLSSLRDWLLPMLMNGQVKVS